MTDSSTTQKATHPGPERALTLLLRQGLYVPSPERDHRSYPGTVPEYIEEARQMDPLDLSPGSRYRAHAKREKRQRCPRGDGVTVNIGSARSDLIQIAPRGVWWFPRPCLVVRHWECESEGRGPLVVVDGRTEKPLTADCIERLTVLACAKRFKLSKIRYLPKDEALVLELARERGIYWD